VRAAARGEAALSPTVAARLVSRVRGPEPGALSPREREILGFVARGVSNKDVSRRLFISEATVKPTWPTPTPSWA
jgi:DNA-binding NarL/FixJ family response regulator